MLQDMESEMSWGCEEIAGIVRPVGTDVIGIRYSFYLLPDLAYAKATESGHLSIALDQYDAYPCNLSMLVLNTPGTVVVLEV